MYFSCILLTNSGSGPFVCVDLIACCSISDFPGFVARQLDESRSIYSKLRPTSRLFKRYVFQTHIKFYAWYLPDSTCFDFVNHDLSGRPRWLIWIRRPTGDQEVAGSTPAEVGNILSWRLIMKYFQQSFSPFRWWVVSFWRKNMHTTG